MIVLKASHGAIYVLGPGDVINFYPVNICNSDSVYDIRVRNRETRVNMVLIEGAYARDKARRILDKIAARISEGTILIDIGEIEDSV